MKTSFKRSGLHNTLTSCHYPCFLYVRLWYDVENATAVNITLLLFPFLPRSRFLHPAQLQHPCLGRRPISIAENLQECSVQCVKQISTESTETRRKNRKISFHMLFPFSLKSVWGILMRGVRVQRKFLCFVVLHFTFSLFPPQSRVILLPVLGSSCTSWTWDRKHGRCQWSSRH